MTAHTFIKVDKATFYTFVQAQAEGRYEYVRGRIMQQQQGGTFKHVRIADRFREALNQQLNQADWVVSTSDRGVDTGETVRYPDVVVEPVGADPNGLSTSNPAVLVEVLSHSSEDRDLYVKPAEYLALSTLQAYIVASQDEVACVVWVRDSRGQFLADGIDVKGLDAVVEVKAMGVSIPLRQIYAGLVS